MGNIDQWVVAGPEIRLDDEEKTNPFKNISCFMYVCMYVCMYKYVCMYVCMNIE